MLQEHIFVAHWSRTTRLKYFGMRFAGGLVVLFHLMVPRLESSTESKSHGGMQSTFACLVTNPDVDARQEEGSEQVD